MKWIKFISIYILVLVAVNAFAQQERKFIRKGNKLYEKENYQESEIQYRRAIDKDKNSYSALFNIGDALYKQQKYEDATKHFNDLSGKQLDKEDKAKLYHNIGNSMLQNQKLKESIEAYKEALRNNPNDMDTKYNLAYAQKMMQQQVDQNNDGKDQEVSEFAKKLKKQAEVLVLQKKYREAYSLMKEGEKIDKTVAAFSDFTNRILDVIKIGIE
ncbi:MAG: tetratricopeptide repeat protein [Bacteroidales bacterium]|jgi:tetratricopeptide (TPR) repeat protein|nr:tetratricopeptide repeat protein [Bacteroidales bacterium]